MKLNALITTLATIMVALSAFKADAQERYLSFDIVGGMTVDDIGGFNVLDGASTVDSLSNDHFGVALSYGVRDAVTVSGNRITPELDFVWFGSHTTTSSNVDGSQSYQTSIQTARLGANFWWPILETSTWRTEMGLGAGIMRREIDVLGTLDAGSSDEFSGYGQLGIRALRPVGKRGNFKAGISYVRTGETDVDIFEIGSGTPAGIYTVDTSSVELRIGYELKLN